MPLSSQRILDLAATPSTSGIAGTCEALARQLQREHQQGHRGPTVNSHTDFLDALRRRPPGDDTPGTIYLHPGRAGEQHSRRPRPRNPDGSPGQTPPFRLSAADITWISRLPEPTKVSFRDAEQLAILAAQVKDQDPADVRLVQSVWEPVRAIHDRAAAEHALKQARRPDPEFPRAHAIAAVEHALADEVPALTPQERGDRARRLVDEALTRRAAHRDDRIAAAQDALRAATAEPALTGVEEAHRDHTGNIVSAGAGTP